MATVPSLRSLCSGRLQAGALGGRSFSSGIIRPREARSPAQPLSQQVFALSDVCSSRLQPRRNQTARSAGRRAGFQPRQNNSRAKRVPMRCLSGGKSSPRPMFVCRGFSRAEIEPREAQVVGQGFNPAKTAAVRSAFLCAASLEASLRLARCLWVAASAATQSTTARSAHRCAASLAASLRRSTGHPLTLKKLWPEVPAPRFTAGLDSLFAKQKSLHWRCYRAVPYQTIRIPPPAPAQPAETKLLDEGTCSTTSSRAQFLPA
jgi:hypothetical protein